MKPFFLFFILLSNLAFSQNYSIKSPDGKLSLQFSLNSDGTPVYALTAGQQQIVGQSKMGIVIKDDPGFTRDLAIT